MTPKTRTIESREQILRYVYLDIAVCLGGMLAVRPNLLSSEAVWEVSRSLAGLFRHHCRELSGSGETVDLTEVKPHPAIVSLIKEVQGTD